MTKFTEEELSRIVTAHSREELGLYPALCLIQCARIKGRKLTDYTQEERSAAAWFDTYFTSSWSVDTLISKLTEQGLT